MLDELFEPVSIGKMELRNRIVLLTSSMSYSENHRGTQRDKAFFAERAKGGAGLIIVGILFPIDMGDAIGGSMGIYEDSLIPGLIELTKVVHHYEAKTAAQLAL